MGRGTGLGDEDARAVGLDEVVRADVRHYFGAGEDFGAQLFGEAEALLEMIH